MIPYKDCSGAFSMLVIPAGVSTTTLRGDAHVLLLSSPILARTGQKRLQEQLARHAAALESLQIRNLELEALLKPQQLRNPPRSTPKAIQAGQGLSEVMVRATARLLLRVLLGSKRAKTPDLPNHEEILGFHAQASAETQAWCFMAGELGNLHREALCWLKRRIRQLHMLLSLYRKRSARDTSTLSSKIRDTCLPRSVTTCSQQSGRARS